MENVNEQQEKAPTAVRELRVGRIAGLTSYELAVKHGYTKSEEEFVNEQIGNAFLLQELIDKVEDLSRRFPDGVKFVIKDGKVSLEYDPEN